MTKSAFYSTRKVATSLILLLVAGCTPEARAQIADAEKKQRPRCPHLSQDTTESLFKFVQSKTTSNKPTMEQYQAALGRDPNSACTFVGRFLMATEPDWWTSGSCTQYQEIELVRPFLKWIRKGEAVPVRRNLSPMDLAGHSRLRLVNWAQNYILSKRVHLYSTGRLWSTEKGRQAYVQQIVSERGRADAWQALMRKRAHVMKLLTSSPLKQTGISANSFKAADPAKRARVYQLFDSKPVKKVTPEDLQRVWKN